jgi:hypothetical protein
MKARSFVAIIALLALLPAAGVWGQAQTTGSVTGTIVDENGAPIAGAEVTLTGPAIQGERASRTNSSGQFTTRLLPPGQYTAVITAPGYQAAVMTFRVLVGETQGLNVTLYPGMELAEEIVVYGRTTPMESAETRANFDYTTDVEELPIQSRNINNIAYNAPNTSFGPNAGQVAVAGAPSYDTVVLLDGAEISDPYFGSGTTVYLEDSIQEVQVLTTGISARYGRFQGGVINAVTKSGGNEFSGILRAELDNEDWNSKSPFGETLTDDLNKVYQGTLGGYILRDRLWFFGGYRTIPATSFTTVTRTTGESIAGGAEEDRFQIKLRGALTPNHTLDASYLEFDAVTANRAGLPAGDRFAFGDRTDPRDMTSLTYQGIFGFNTFIDAMATEKNVQISSGGSPTGGDPFLWTTAGNWVYNNHWWDATDPSVRDNQTAALNVSHSLETGFGSHMLQGGVQWVESTTAGDNRQSATGYNLVAFTTAFNPRIGPGGDVIFDLLPFQAERWVATNLRATNNVENTAFYIQDSINWNNFRFDLGARYDSYKGSTTGVQGFDLSFNDISPRLGVTYNITPGWQVVGTWGKYTGRFNDSWGENASGVSSAPRVVDDYIGPPLIGASRTEIQNALRNDDFWELFALVGDPAFPTVYVSRDAESPYSEEFNISLRTALPRNSGFASLTYTHRDYNNLFTGFTGLPCTDFGLCEGAGDYSAVPGGRVVDTTVWANDPRTRRDYDGLAVQFDYRPTGRMNFGGNWTWSETRGNYEGEALNQPASGSVWGSRERNKPMESAAPYGYLAPHIRHRANVYGTYRFGLGRAGALSTSGIVNYRTGRVYSRTAAVAVAAVPEYVTSTGSYTHFFDGRGNNEFPSVWSLDTALRYSVPLIAGVSPFVKLDVRNVLNLDRLISWQTTGVAVPVNRADGSRSHFEWAGSGSANPNAPATYNPACDPDSGQFSPSRTCTGFGRIAGPANYQVPRTFLLSVGLQF